jgi:NTE family protein
MKGLVLEGGGVKGAYQIGSYYAFRDRRIKFNGIVGTSIGAFNAAMLASGRERELLKFWYELSPGVAMNFDSDFVEGLNNKKFALKSLIGAFKTIKDIIKNSGLDYTKLLSMIEPALNYDKLISSNLDFGLVTVRISKKDGLQPIYVYKENIKNKDELLEYIMASCYLPVFRRKKIIDNHYYLDGGLYDNAPFKLLLDKGYDELFIVNIKGIGFTKKVPKDIKVTYISPSRDNGSILELDRNVIKDNIKMGYYDTIRVLKKLDGYKYCFKRKNEKYYKFLCRKVDKKLLKRIMNFFNVDTYKDAVIKSLEYVLEKDDISYYDVYKSSKFIKYYKKVNNNKFIYMFIKELKFFF